MTPTNYTYSLDRFYQHLGESVLFFPANIGLKLETFAAILSEADLAPENLTKDERDARTPYFTSKRYLKKQGSIIDYDFPLLVAMPLSESVQNCFKSTGPYQIQNKVQIAVMEPFIDSKDETKTRKDRSIVEIQRDTSKTLLRVIDYIKKLQFAKVTKLDASIVYDYYNPEYLAYLLAQSKITAYEVNTSALERATASIRVNLEYSNTLCEFMSIGPISGKNLYGTSVIIEFYSLDCEAPTFDYTFAENNFIYGNSCI